MKITSREEFEKINVFGMDRYNSKLAAVFSGKSYLVPLPEEGDCPIHISNVTFEPGCRNNWHVHTASKGGGQVLLCTAGEGWYQEEGKAAVELLPGTVINIPAGVKHWHGAKKDSWFVHISITVPGEGCGIEWLERVDDEAYSGLD